MLSLNAFRSLETCHDASPAETRFPPRLIESVELAELMQLRARRAEIVGLVLPVAVADRHAAEQHLVLRQFQEIAD